MLLTVLHDTDYRASDYDNIRTTRSSIESLDTDGPGYHDMDDHNAVQNLKMTGKFMPPNQQKLELLKKGVGVESEFDDEGDA